MVANLEHKFIFLAQNLFCIIQLKIFRVIFNKINEQIIECPYIVKINFKLFGLILYLICILFCLKN